MRFFRGVGAFCCIGLAHLALACGDDGSSSGGGGSGASGAGDAGGSGGGSGCVDATQCGPNEICDPQTNQCASNVPCQEHAECGKAAICAGGTCEENESGGPCDDTDNCIAPETCTGGVCGCGGAVYGADEVPPNVLVVLDRSSSMNEDIGGGTKWNIARQAINDLAASSGANILFGLMMYPGTDLSGNQGMDCGPGAVFVDPAPDTAGTIATDLAGAGTTSFGTPTAEALTPLLAYTGLQDPERNNYILLITDGQSTCNDPVPVVAQLLAASPSVPTFVVGFGGGVDPNELNNMAQAGGTAGAQTPYYFQADDADSLAAAFAAIAGSVLSCSYVLSETPPDPDQLYVWIDGVLTPQDASNGWTYDAETNQITFNGTTCADLQSGGADSLVISYGCPAPPPPQ